MYTDTVKAAVMDGVTIGHPCCNEYDCKEPLRKVYDELCPIHECLGVLCSVDGCFRAKEHGFRTCNSPSHRFEEIRRKNQNRKLPRSVKRVGSESTNNSNNVDAISSKPVKLSGKFSRRWTHNEQLMVRPCGIIIGRATFYTSESMSAVKVSI